MGSGSDIANVRTGRALGNGLSPLRKQGKSFMKLAILGAGAVGCHLAARLASVGVDFTLVARPAAAEALERRGLRFMSASEDFTVSVSVAGSTSGLGQQDVVIVALKAHSLSAAIDDIAPLIVPQTIVVFAVNGIPWWYGLSGEPAFGSLEILDPGGRIAATVGIERSVGCVVHSANTMVDATTVRNTSARNSFFLGPADGTQSPKLQKLSTILAGALGNVTVTDDIRHEVWRKLQHNLAASLIGCLTRSRADQIAADPGLSDLYRTIRWEGRQVAATLGIDLPDDTEAQLVHMTTLQHRASMLQDLLAGRKLEIAAQILAVCDVASRFNVQTPTIDLLVALLQNLENRHGDSNE